jgi:hypothetical protein
MRFRFGPFWVATESKPRKQEVNPNVAIFVLALSVLPPIVAAVWSVVG